MIGTDVPEKMLDFWSSRLAKNVSIFKDKPWKKQSKVVFSKQFLFFLNNSNRVMDNKAKYKNPKILKLKIMNYLFVCRHFLFHRQ